VGLGVDETNFKVENVAHPPRTSVFRFHLEKCPKSCLISPNHIDAFGENELFPEKARLPEAPQACVWVSLQKLP
jgi:hypothetical protein